MVELATAIRRRFVVRGGCRGRRKEGVSAPVPVLQRRDHEVAAAVAGPDRPGHPAGPPLFPLFAAERGKVGADCAMLCQICEYRPPPSAPPPLPGIHAGALASLTHWGFRSRPCCRRAGTAAAGAPARTRAWMRQASGHCEDSPPGPARVRRRLGLSERRARRFSYSFPSLGRRHFFPPVLAQSRYKIHAIQTAFLRSTWKILQACNLYWFWAENWISKQPYCYFLYCLGCLMLHVTVVLFI
ncbi:hypothetical protein BS78_04G116400 [Paspalum vaginatum]|nr:hypothetical protein BS78_04G116400 [Paspalum vaginatum]